MIQKGDIFKNNFYGDYWKVVDIEKDHILIEATYFSGRPKRCHEIHVEEYKECPFLHCDYALNQFCFKEKYLDKRTKISAIEFEIADMKNEVVYGNWIKRDKTGHPTLTKRRLIYPIGFR